MLGESGVGKTCIVSRYINDTFTHNPCTTGANYNSKVESVKLEGMTKNVKVKLQIWDTAGSEQFRALAPIYYREAAAICLVYDSTNVDTFEHLQYWYNELDNNNVTGALLSVIASKTDVETELGVPVKRALDFSAKINANLYETSSQTGEGIKPLFENIAARLLLKSIQKNSFNERSGSVLNSKQKQKKSGCC